MKDKAERTKNRNEKFLQVLEYEEQKKLALNVKRGNLKKEMLLLKKMNMVIFYIIYKMGFIK